MLSEAPRRRLIAEGWEVCWGAISVKWGGWDGREDGRKGGGWW